MVNVSEAIQKIKSVKPANVRIVPMIGEGVDGNQQIEICVNGTWQTVVAGIKRPMAEDLIRQTTNRVLLG